MEIHESSRACEAPYGTGRGAPTFLLRLLNLQNRCPDKNCNAASSSGGLEMNHSFYSADRATHLKIVVVALVAATAVAGVTITARVNAGDTYAQSNQIQVIKAGKPVMVTKTDQSVVR
jgi:hypothetical protein